MPASDSSQSTIVRFDPGNIEVPSMCCVRGAVFCTGDQSVVRRSGNLMSAGQCLSRHYQPAPWGRYVLDAVGNIREFPNYLVRPCPRTVKLPRFSFRDDRRV